MTQDFTKQTKQLIDNLKGICANYGLGNDGNEFKIITQSFLYKFLNDKFGYEVRSLDPKLALSENWESDIVAYSDNDFNMLLARMPPGSARLRPEHFISHLFSRQTEENFAQLFDDTLRDIAIKNNSVFSVHTIAGTNIRLFDDSLSSYIADNSERDNFCRAIINQLVESSFEGIFSERFDFFSTIFEYMIKDYNKDGGGKYAEYYTPHAVAKVMAQILVNDGVSNVTCYDPAAGSGTLLMNLAHAIGEDKCSIFSQDISQKSSGLLRLNLILNGLTHSINNIVQGNTILKPAHIKDKFDYIVSNPPFKLDFSDYQPELLANNTERFFAGVPNIPNKDVDKMAIYLLFIQHIMYSLTSKGKAAIVVPTGFLTAPSGIEKRIREELVDKKILRGVVSMPSNIFATTGTNVSILFLDKTNTSGEIVLMDASKLGTVVKEGKNQKTLLSDEEEQKIITTFNEHNSVEDFSIVVSSEEVKEKKYSISAGQYFEVKVEYTDISPLEFAKRVKAYTDELDGLFAKSRTLETEIKQRLTELKYDN
jgi:type I restriction enzyme M protein